MKTIIGFLIALSAFITAFAMAAGGHGGGLNFGAYALGEDQFWTVSSAVDVTDGVTSSDRAQLPWEATYAAGTITLGSCA